MKNFLDFKMNDQNTYVQEILKVVQDNDKGNWVSFSILFIAVIGSITFKIIKRCKQKKNIHIELENEMKNIDEVDKVDKVDSIKVNSFSDDKKNDGSETLENIKFVEDSLININNLYKEIEQIRKGKVDYTI